MELLGLARQPNAFVGTVGRPTARIGKSILRQRDHLKHGGLDRLAPITGNCQTRLLGHGSGGGHGEFQRKTGLFADVLGRVAQIDDND